MKIGDKIVCLEDNRMGIKSGDILTVNDIINEDGCFRTERTDSVNYAFPATHFFCDKGKRWVRYNKKKVIG